MRLFVPRQSEKLTWRHVIHAFAVLWRLKERSADSWGAVLFASVCRDVEGNLESFIKHFDAGYPK